MGKAQSQCRAAIEWMETVGPITPLDAKDNFSCMRLSARIDDIKNGRGVPARDDVHDRFVRVVNKEGEPCRVKAYWLDTTPLVHRTVATEGFMARGRCGAEGVVTRGFSRRQQDITCPHCRALEEEIENAELAEESVSH